MLATRELLGWDDALYEALKRRAKRNFRTVRAEIRAILAEALREEAHDAPTRRAYNRSRRAMMRGGAPLLALLCTYRTACASASMRSSYSLSG